MPGKIAFKSMIMITASLLAMLGFGATANATTAAQTPEDIWNVGSSIPGASMCLGITGSSTAGGARAVQGYCSNSVNDTSQEWTYRDWKSGSFPIFQLQNAKSGLCLGVQGGSGASGAQIVQGKCGPASDYSQFWYFDGTTPAYTLANFFSGYCMGIKGASTASGADVIQEKCYDPSTFSTQEWNSLLFSS